MAKSKKKLVAEAVKKAQVTPSQLSIEERLAGCGRNEPEHIEYVGEVVERALNGEFGAILKALTAGRLSMEMNSAKTSGRSSDWHLGRATMANDLWHDFEQYVIDKDKLREALVTNEEEENGLQET